MSVLELHSVILQLSFVIKNDERMERRMNIVNEETLI